ncbi:MAG: diguanylate cyclase [Rubrivivax sp.]|nr:diguanylate cyclase [Rubrivivax sp.]
MAAEQSTHAAVATLAKGALRRLAQAHLEPTPENYARAFAEEAGTPPNRARPAPLGWPVLMERLMRNLERGGRQWTAARRKESLYRVLDSSRSDEERLAQRLRSLLQAWESDRLSEGIEPLEAVRPIVAPTTPSMPAALETEDKRSPQPSAAESAVRALSGAVCVGLGEGDARAVELVGRLRRLAEDCAAQVALPDVADGSNADLAEVCGQAKLWFGQRHELMRQLTGLCSEMSQGLVELTEDESWSRGQCEALSLQLAEALDVRAVRAASAMLAETRARQASAKREREAARSALKQLLTGMIGEVGALQQQAGGFESAIEQHASAVEAADSLEGLTSVVQAMLADSRGLRSAIGASHERLLRDSSRAAALETRVRDLEAELRRLSDEASTDALTQVANRRGLEQIFVEVSARAVEAAQPLAVGLIDIDNFKRLNDRLGHAAGDTALKVLASEVSKRLRPEDHVARFGGEEFVVLLPGQPVAQAQQALTRLQRSLSAGLFLHEGEEVFVTFSAGVTVWRPGETLEAAVERADGGLYEAKRSGKNRTCAG